MSEKKNQKTIEELYRSRMSAAAAGEIWPSLSQTSNHRLLRSPSPRESFSRSRRRTENTTRHSLFPSRPLSTDLIPGIPKQHSGYEGEKRCFLQSSHEVIKRPFFPGIPAQVVTHAEPPFPATDTQPLPPINMPRAQQEKACCTIKTGQDNRPYTVVGQTPFEGSATHDLVCSATEERRGKRKLEAIKRPVEGEDRQDWRVSRQYRDDNQHSKKKCADNKKGRRARKFQRPLAWKSPWPTKDNGNDSEWEDIN